MPTLPVPLSGPMAAPPALRGPFPARPMAPVCARIERRSRPIAPAVGVKLLLVAPPQLARNLTSDASPERLAETGYSHPFPSDFTLLPGWAETNLASLSSRRAARRGERDASLVLAGSSKPEWSQLLTRAIASAPAGDHAHGNDAILTLYMCCCSASIVPMDGPPPISAGCRRR